MSELVTTRIRATAAKLGLPHLVGSLEQFTARADAQAMGYLDFLDLILEEELAVRDERRFRNGLRLSKLPHYKTLDAYDFSFQPDLDPRKVRDLATLAFVQARFFPDRDTAARTVVHRCHCARAGDRAFLPRQSGPCAER